jgi:hypothetical protein
VRAHFRLRPQIATGAAGGDALICFYCVEREENIFTYMFLLCRNEEEFLLLCFYCVEMKRKCQIAALLKNMKQRRLQLLQRCW